VQGKNPKESNMAEAKSNTIENSTTVALRQFNGSSNQASSFKYYIHDSVNTCRLELLGELHERDLTELNGCWQTIKTTVRTRQLVLDLRRLDYTDTASSRWLMGMANEGATYLPASYFSGIQQPKEATEKGKLNPFTRVLGLLRSACAANAD
jgi:hypothetical protein